MKLAEDFKILIEHFKKSNIQFRCPRTGSCKGSVADNFSNSLRWVFISPTSNHLLRVWMFFFFFLVTFHIFVKWQPSWFNNLSIVFKFFSVIYLWFSIHAASLRRLFIWASVYWLFLAAHAPPLNFSYSTGIFLFVIPLPMRYLAHIHLGPSSYYGGSPTGAQSLLVLIFVILIVYV